MIDKRYNISVDIGTNSVGWAVTDQNSKLLKKGSKNLWGVNLFESASTAADRRMLRGTRRRYTRRKARIHLLQDLIGDIILKKDPNFFKRLEYSYLTEDDRKTKLGKKELNVIFGNDVPAYDYGKDYKKSIYHLRKYLMTCDEAADPRLIYLALHHCVKYRGNFLYEGQDIKSSGSKNALQRLNDVFELLNQYYETDVFSTIDVITYLSIIENKANKLADRIDNAMSLVASFDKSNKDALKELSKALLGYSFNYKKLVNGLEDLKFKLSDDALDSESKVVEKYAAADMLFAVLDVYNYVVLSRIIGPNSSGTYSDAMIEIFDKHKSDLALLKTVFKAYLSSTEYNNFFKKKAKNNYYSWINNPKECNQDDFYKTIKVKLEKCEEKGSILEDIENLNFLPKQTNSTNSAIPYQLNLEEMEAIIDNQGRFYPELLENKDKICSILTFRIPYYVGPLVTSKYNDHAWIERRLDIVLKPWNFDEVVDKEVTAKRFIEKMKNHCTYLLAETTLPKNSLLYSEYEVLNELNKVRVKGNFLDKDSKKAVIEGLFKKKVTVTVNDFVLFLKREQIVTSDITVDDVTGTQKEDKFATSLKPWIDFKKIYGDDFDSSKKEIETIIEWLSVYNDKSIIKTRINKEFAHISEEQINKLLRLNYSGYGRLSRKLLEELPIPLGKNVSGFVIDALRETNQNLMQILNNNKYGLMEIIRIENGSNDKKSLVEMVNDLPGSPAVKRGILQTLRIIKELEEYFGHPADRIFVEMAREEGEKRRTVSREKKYKEIYDALIRDGITIDGKLISKSDETYKLITEQDLKDEKILLYVLQNGKSMYSKKPLSIDDLDNCEVDHIIPQSYIKDDSIDNKALVLREENQLKRDDLMLDEEIVRKCEPFWRELWKNKLISDKKYYNLIKAKRGITENEKIGFINRQLVETRQICKHVVNLLKVNRNDDCEIVSVYAGLTSEFRKKHGLYKIRSLNDTHHAHDAFLAAVIGNFILKKYPYMSSGITFDGYNKYGSDVIKQIAQDISDRIYEEKAGTKSGNPKANFNSFIIHQMGKYPKSSLLTGEVVWNGENDINYIKKVLNYKDYYITYKTETGQTELYNQTIYGKNEFKAGMRDGHGAFSMNADRPIEKYGGYKSAKVAYGYAVEYKKGKKTIRTVATIPMTLYFAGVEEIKQYISEEVNCAVSDIKLIKKLFNGQVMVHDNNLVTMASPSEWNIRRQLFLPVDLQKVMYCVEKKYLDNVTDQELVELFDFVLRTTMKNVPIIKEQCNGLLKNKNKFDALTKEEKVKSLNQIITACSSGKPSPDILLGTFRAQSRMGRLSGKAIDLNKAEFLFQSITGIYETKVKL